MVVTLPELMNLYRQCESLASVSKGVLKSPNCERRLADAACSCVGFGQVPTHTTSLHGELTRAHPWRVPEHLGTTPNAESKKLCRNIQIHRSDGWPDRSSV